MGRVNDDQWLDEALNQALHSDDTRPDFQQWIANHPEAVEKLTARTPETQRPPRIRRILMNVTAIKLAAAALIALVAIVGAGAFAAGQSVSLSPAPSQPSPPSAPAPMATAETDESLPPGHPNAGQGYADSRTGRHERAFPVCG